MKSTIYTIEDEYLGIPLLIEGEVITFADEFAPEVIINDISLLHAGTPLALWAFSDRFIEHLKDRIYQQWANEK